MCSVYDLEKVKDLSFFGLSIGTKSNLLSLANLQTSNLDKFKSN